MHYDYVLTVIVRATHLRFSISHHIKYEICNRNRKDLTAFSQVTISSFKHGIHSLKSFKTDFS